MQSGFGQIVFWQNIKKTFEQMGPDELTPLILEEGKKGSDIA
jgi:hypothetical protein